LRVWPLGGSGAGVEHRRVRSVDQGLGQLIADIVNTIRRCFAEASGSTVLAPDHSPG